MKTITTNDGSQTLFESEYGEYYHSLSGAREEARLKFAVPALSFFEEDLKDQINIMDIGFGLAYNSLEIIRLIMKLNPSTEIYITAIEKNLKPLQKITEIHKEEKDPQINSLIDAIKKNNGEEGIYKKKNITLDLIQGDARNILRGLDECKSYSIVLLDGFSTRTNPELWTVEFFKLIKRILTPKGIILTYSSAYPVISGALEAGFKVGGTTAVGRKTGGLALFLEDKGIFQPPEHEKERINTTGIIPFRDPGCSFSRNEILKTYENERLQMIDKGIPSIKSYRKQKIKLSGP